MINTGSTTARVTYLVSLNGNSCGTGSNVKVDVTPLPVFTVTANKNICSGQAAILTAQSAMADVTYEWTAASNNILVSGYSDETGNTINQTLINTDNKADTVFYTATANNGCYGSPITSPVLVHPVPVLTATPLLNAICSTDNADILFGSSIPNTTFSWTHTVSSSALTGASDGSGNSISQALTNTSATMQTVTYAIKGTAGICSSTTQAGVNVKPVPVFTVSGTAICTGETINIAIAAPADAIITWEATGSAATVSGYADGAGNTISQQLTNSGNTDATVTYAIAMSHNGCPAPSKSAVARIHPVPVVSVLPYKPTICSGEVQKIDLVSNTGTVNFSWTTSTTGSDVTGNKAGSGTSFSHTIYNKDAVAADVLYTIRANVTCKPPDLIVTFKVYPYPIAETVSDKSVCAGEQSFHIGAEEKKGIFYSWRPGTLLDDSTSSDPLFLQQPDIAVKTQFNITLDVMDSSSSCAAKNAVTITVYPVVKADAGRDLEICPGKEVTLGPETPDKSIQQKWFLSGNEVLSTESRPVVFPRTTTFYTVTVTNGYCSDSDSVKILVNDVKASVYIPNAFTPNDDGVNDLFSVVSSDVTEIDVKIFNRWGEFLYEWKDLEGGWNGYLDGQLVQNDVYVYLVRSKGVCDRELSKPVPGTVTLVK